MKSKTLNKVHAPLLDSGEVTIGPLAHLGSSGAELWLIQACDGKTIVRKSSSVHPVKLLEQFNWLNENSSIRFFPKVFNPIQKHEFFSYDMPFYDKSQSLNYLLSSRDNIEVRSITSLFENLKSNFYQELDHSFSISSYEYYISEKVLKKVKFCEMAEDTLATLFTSEFITVNGKRLHNFPTIWKRLQHPEIQKLIRSFNNKAIDSIHGDLTAENILVTEKGEMILLDPNQENLISTYAVEVAKIFQSLHSNYEHLATCHFDFKDIYIDYNYIISKKREQLSEAILSDLLHSMLLSRHEVVFHEAIHFARMLPYKLFRTKSFPVYYARMIELFNQVLW